MSRTVKVRPVTETTLYKVLGKDRQPVHGGVGQWPEPGEWHSVAPPIIPCERGLHVCMVDDLIAWVRDGVTLWAVEVAGERIAHAGKVVVERARLLECIGPVSPVVLCLWACDCAERVAHVAGDVEPVCREAIRVARLAVMGLATHDQLAAARVAARDAARAVAGDAARSAARAAAWAAQSAAGDVARAAARADALAAARAVARDGAWAAARAAERAAAGDAAWNAARYGAWATARYAAWAAERAAERAWQGARLIDIVRREARVVAA